ncbi:SDR family NAD(P)-dependent oxidoreductase [Streptomyces sp. HUAS MG47]|uniref:SDR family NAD(P)-dependent oxidoreductase n=1 Tax=Streptomyces solicamelliae TaxID=3231716 RepID=UPI003877F853
MAVTADVADPDAMIGIAETALARYGRIDVWVNAAGVGVLGRLDQIPSGDLRRQWEVNVLGAFHGMRRKCHAEHSGSPANAQSQSIASPYRPSCPPL